MSRFAMHRAQIGLTLIELMISITIGLVVVGAVTYAYVGSQGAYRGNESLARIQEAGRFALDSIARDIRGAGALGCGSAGSLAGQARVNVIAPAGTGINPAQLMIDASGQPIPIVGFKPVSYGPPLPVTAPTGWTPPGGAATYWGGDVLQLQIGTGVAVRMSAAPDTGAGNITIPDNSVAAFKANDYAMLGDCSSATVFQVNSVAAGPPALLSYKTSGGAIPALNAAGLPGFSITTFPTVQHFDQVTYYIGQTPAGRSALYRYSMSRNTTEEVAENVEDMDVMYGVSTTGAIGDGSFQHADAMTAADWPNVISVRVSLVAVGDQQGAAPSNQTLQFHGGGWTAPDTRLRQVFTATAAMRDRQLVVL
jgi:type IV pilus assembly protein PilW